MLFGQVVSANILISRVLRLPVPIFERQRQFAVNQIAHVDRAVRQMIFYVVHLMPEMSAVGLFYSWQPTLQPGAGCVVKRRVSRRADLPRPATAVVAFRCSPVPLFSNSTVASAMDAPLGSVTVRLMVALAFWARIGLGHRRAKSAMAGMMCRMERTMITRKTSYEQAYFSGKLIMIRSKRAII